MAITDPRDISGLVAWYSAEAETGYSDNDDMTGWTDLSGNGNHATTVTDSAGGPKWRSSASSAGGPAVQFLGIGQFANSGYFLLPNVFSGASAVEALFMVKAGSPTNNGFNRFDASGDNSHYPFSGTVYDKFASTLRRSFTPSVAVTSWRRYNTWSAANDWAARLDGTSQLTAATNTVSLHSAPTIGYDQGTGDWAFGGHMSAVILFNRKLTTGERSDLDAWLAANPSGGTTSAPAPNGPLDAIFPAFAVDLAGTNTNPTIAGALDATFPAFTITADGVANVQAGLDATFPSFTVSASGEVTRLGTLDASFPAFTVTTAGVVADVTTGALDAAFPAFTVALVGDVDDSVGTDTDNLANGRRRHALAYVETDVVVTTRPAHLRRGHEYYKAIALTEAVLDDGRPT